MVIITVQPMNRIPVVDLKAQYQSIRGEVLQVIEAVCESGCFAQGPATLEFEREFAAYCGVKHCITLNSGTSALHAAMMCLGIGPGDEVIVPSMTFISTAWCVRYVGATPVFADIDPVRRALDPERLAAMITPKTKAIIPVHLYGQPADMDPILAIAGAHGIPVVEDTAHSVGARYKGRRAGQFGAMACTSFYPGKTIGAYGEGGALLANDDDHAAHARRLRDHGQSRRYYHDEVGFNYRMDSIQGAVLSIKLKYLDQWNAARAALARRYHELLQGLPVTLPAFCDGDESAWHLYVIECDNRDAVREKLSAAGVDSGLHYPVPLHLQKVFAGLGHGTGDFPVAEKLARRCLSLPMYAELTEEQINTVAIALRHALQG